jgi:CHAT domain-containing protein/tetratricopeptide (TPR) repeat protein
LAIRRRILGEEHPHTAYTYNNLAAVLSKQRQYAEAEKLARKALAINRKVLGEDHPVTAMTYNTLALTLNKVAQYAEVEKMLRKALAITRKILGEDHPYTAISYINLASNLNDQAQYAEAEMLHRKALGIFRNVRGEEHPDTAASYTNLALTLNKVGRYAKAEKMLRKALAIRRKVLGKDHRDTAMSYHNLACNLSDQGQYAEGQKLSRKALEIIRNACGEEHPDTARCYGSLAEDLRAQGKYPEAERLNRKALEILRKVHGEEHRDTATSYNNLGNLLRELGQHAEAEMLHRKAMEIEQKVLGENDPRTAIGYNNLAAVMRDLGKYAEAERLNRKALKILQKVHGEEHPDTGMTYANLAADIYLKGDYAKAEEAALAAAKTLQATRLRVSFTGLGRTTFGTAWSPEVFLAPLLARNGKPAQAWKCFEEHRGRGLFDDLNARYSRSQKLSDRERQEEDILQGELAGIEKQLAELLGRTKTNAKEIEKLRSRRDQLMLILVEHQSKMEKKYGPAAGQVYGLEKIQAWLAADAALVGWVDLGVPFTAKDPSGEHWGVVLRHKGAPAWVKLEGTVAGKWGEKDDLVPEITWKLLLDSQSDPSDQLRILNRQRLRPLEKHLQGVTHLVVLPSSAMAVIPLEALTDRYRVSYAPSGTIYAWLQEKRKNSFRGTGDLLALGDAVFSEEQTKAEAKRQGKGTMLAAALKDQGTRALRGKNLDPLHGTRGEVEGIARLFTDRKAQVVLLGPNANAANLAFLAQKEEAARFRYLHLATHGFPDSTGGMNSYLALTSEDLALASYDKLSAGQIMRTWKLDADLVTLSACEAALGEHRGGEGFVGFSQALFFAGARTLVLSQWKVDDKATTLLMHRFYENLLGSRPEQKTPLSKLEALTEAKRWLKGLEAEEAARRVKDLGVKLPTDWERKQPDRPFAHPYFWAAFILVGDPGKADGERK